jgi:hypothetical protein
MARKQKGAAGACPCHKHSHSHSVPCPCRSYSHVPLDDGGTSGKKASIGRSENMWVPMLCDYDGVECSEDAWRH